MTNNIRSPFPGMDPYLESPQLWPDVHNRLIAMMANTLTPQVRPGYYVAIEERVYLTILESKFVGRPDVTLIERDEENPWPRVDEAVVPYRPLVVNLPTSPPDETREPFLEVRQASGGLVQIKEGYK